MLENRPVLVGFREVAMPVRLFLGLLLLWGLLYFQFSAGAADPDPRDLADLSLEELGNIQITSVSKRAERLSHAAASVFVITAGASRPSGGANLPEARRLAPNLQVAHANAAGY